MMMDNHAKNAVPVGQIKNRGREKFTKMWFKRKKNMWGDVESGDELKGCTLRAVKKSEWWMVLQLINIYINSWNYL